MHAEPLLSRAKPPDVQVFTLGGFRVLVGGQLVDDHAWRRRAARQLFKLLLTRPGRRMTRDEVIELFWPESDPDAASSNLRSTVHALRRALERDSSAADLISGDHTSVWLRPNPDLWADADAFELMVAEAWRSTDPLPLLEEASGLYEGDYLPDDVYEDWAVERREALKRTWTELQFGLARALDAHSSDVGAALQPLERLLRSDPCDERAAQELMRLLARHGRRAEALRIYQRLVQSLRDELDVEPSPESAQLQRQINAGEAPAPPPAPATSFLCSYPFPAPSELIARESELATLAQVLVGGRSAGKVALVAAPAGTGKSALLGQVVREAQAQGVLCVAGGCYEERGAVPLGPFHDALVDYLLAQPPDQVRAQFGTTVDDLAQVIPELRYHLQLSADSGSTTTTTTTTGSIDRMRAFGAVHACLRSLAERSPVLVCLEDLHAADEATLQLLHYLARQTRRLPLVLLATYRSDEAPPDQPLAQTVAAMLRERLAQRVTLPALDRDNTERLATALLEGTPSQALSRSLYATTGGNPLFVEQLLLALSEAGQLQRRGGLWEGLADLQGTPQIVREVIAQRLQRLDPSCREILAVAAVLGQSFEHAVLLAAVAPMHEATLLRDVDRAIAAQVLQDIPGGYAFRHALLRDAVYWDVTAPRRMLLHAQMGELLEHFYGTRADDYAAQLAHHFLRAGESPAMRGKALRYSLQAGRHAADLSAYPDSLTHFNRAWDIVEHDPDIADLDARREGLSGRGWAEANLAHYTASIESLRQALALSNDKLQRGRARQIIAFSLSHTGAFDALIEECQAGLAEVEGLSSPDAVEIRAILHQLIGLALLMQGRFRQVVQVGRAIESEAASAGPGPRVYAHLVLGWGYKGQGLVPQAIEQFEQAVSEGKQGADKNDLAVAYENLGLQNFLGGRFVAARESLAQSLALFRESANELRGVNALHTLCRVWAAEGDHLRASQQILQALDLENGDAGRLAADAHHVLGAIQVLHAEWDNARSSFEQALRIRKKSGHKMGIVEATVALGFVDQCLGRWDNALATYLQALDVAEEMDPSPQQVLARRSLGLLRLLAGDGAAAATELQQALALAETMPETLEYAPTLLAMAELRLQAEQLEPALIFARQSLDAARPLEHVAEANIVLASIHLARGDVEAAQQYAAAATLHATRLAAPRLLARACLVTAQVERLLKADTATASFQLALRHAEAAGTPVERAAVRRAFADHLRAGGSDWDVAQSMEAEAETLVRTLTDSPTRRPGFHPCNR